MSIPPTVSGIVITIAALCAFAYEMSLSTEGPETGEYNPAPFCEPYSSYRMAKTENGWDVCRNVLVSESLSGCSYENRCESVVRYPGRSGPVPEVENAGPIGEGLRYQLTEAERYDRCWIKSGDEFILTTNDGDKVRVRVTTDIKLGSFSVESEAPLPGEVSLNATCQRRPLEFSVCDLAEHPHCACKSDPASCRGYAKQPETEG